MKLHTLPIAIVAILVFSSCSSIRTLSSKDSPSSATALKKAPPKKGKREFITDIEVTPGGMVTAVKQKGNTTVVKQESFPKEKITQGKPDARLAGTGIEDADLLQIKYAIATDATVEKLTNIPLLQVIDKWWGTKYCMGGVTDDCIDCSAFTQVVLRDVYKISLPRTSQEQYSQSDRIELEDLREGDLVFFNTGGSDVSHVGIYLLNNKFVHAATSGGVMISDLNDKYWQPKFRGAGRVTKDVDAKADR